MLTRDMDEETQENLGLIGIERMPLRYESMESPTHNHASQRRHN